MATLLSVSSVSISIAKAAGTLVVKECVSERLGNRYWSISDDRGLICVATTEAEADAIVSEAA